MRIAILSDIHGNLPALDAVLADVRVRGADLMVNLGDTVSGPLFPAETADRLLDLGVPTVRGNHDRYLVDTDPAKLGASDRFTLPRLRPDHLAWLTSLPATQPLLDGSVLLCHGTPDSDEGYFLETVDEDGYRLASLAEVTERARGVGAELILCGHTHKPRVVALPDGRVVVNPGSIGLPAAIVPVPRPHRVENGSPHARYAMAERGHGGWTVSTICVPYDWRHAARQAAGHGFTDWAHALATGWPD